ncbi:MAG: zinc-ribbon domain-containing protein [Deltaproteobacteria bacterium]|jgi:hypothetical protein|nr:zinc-ribbon domain-containing protein [Deltaproteobacteria bacterium]
MKYCKYCGAPLEDNDKFCDNCGKPAGVSESYGRPSNEPSNSNAPLTKKSSLNLYLILSAILVVLFLTGVIVFRIFSTSKPGHGVVSAAVVNENTTSVNLPQGYSLYIYGYGTGGGFQSSAFIKGQYASAINSAGNRVAALAVSKSNFNEFSTQTGYQVAGGIAITGFSRFTSFSGYNTGSGASSASVSFNVKHNNSLVVVVAIAGGGQSLSITGLSGLKTDAAWPGSPNLAMEIVHTYLPKGSYSVSEITSQSAGGQNPNDAGNLIGAFVFY